MAHGQQFDAALPHDLEIGSGLVVQRGEYRVHLIPAVEGQELLGAGLRPVDRQDFPPIALTVAQYEALQPNLQKL